MADKAGVRLEDLTYGSTNGLRPSSIGIAPYYPSGGSSATIVYLMRGKHAVHGWIRWTSNNAPDLTGAGSGYPGALTLITHDPPFYIP